MRKEFKFLPIIEVFSVITSLFLIIIYLLSFLGFNLENIFGNLGDGVFNHYVLEHGYQFLLGNQPDFWKGNFFFPVPLFTMAFSDNHAGTLPIFAFFRVVGYDSYTAYQLWMIALFAINFLAAYFTLRRLMKYQLVASIVGGLFFTLALPVMAKLGHIQLIPRFFLPFIFFSFFQFLARKNIVYLGYTALFIALQYAIGIYMAIFSVEIIVIMAVAYIAIHRLKVKDFFAQSSRDLKKFSVLTFISLVIIVPLLLPYLQISAEYHGRSWSELLTMMPQLGSWFYSTLSPVYPWLSGIGSGLPMAQEHELFVGFIPILLLLFALIGVYKRTEVPSERGLFALTIFLTVLLVGKIGVFALHFFFYQLPGFSSIRAVTRIVIALLFLLAIVISHFLSNFEGKRRWLLLALLSLLIAGEQFVPAGKVGTYSKEEAKLVVRKVIETVQPILQEGEQFFFIPEKMNYPFYVYQLASMQAALEMGVHTVNGYSGFTPHYYSEDIVSFRGSTPAIARELQKYLNFYNQEGSVKSPIVIIKGSEVIKLMPTQEMVSDQLRPVRQYEYDVQFLQKPQSINEDSYEIKIRLSNPGSEVWHSGERGRFGLKLSYTIENANGVKENKIMLPHDINHGAGEEIILNITPLAKGENKISIDLIQRDTGLFHARQIRFSEMSGKKFSTVLNRF